MPSRDGKIDHKGKGKKFKAAVAGTDDDFDGMLAEFRAADVTTTAAATSSRSENRSASSTPRVSTAKAENISEEALVQACGRGDISQLRRWAKRGLRVSSAQPLCKAVSEGMVDAARCLVRELGADVNQTNIQGFTPLCIATEMCNLEMAKCLVVELGADADQANTNALGFTPLCRAAQMNNLEVAKWLTMELGADVNRANKRGYSPLYGAALIGNLEVLQCLAKELGADVNQADEVVNLVRRSYEWTPGHCTLLGRRAQC
jgi:hypothetical protein